MGSASDRLVIQGEEIHEGTSLYVRSSAKVAWITSIEGDELRLEALDESTSISRGTFREGVVDGDLVLEVQPAGHRDAQ